MNTAGELAFIREALERNRQLRTYWIGGSTDAKIGSTINYSDYNTTELGNHFAGRSNKRCFEILCITAVQVGIKKLVKCEILTDMSKTDMRR